MKAWYVKEIIGELNSIKIQNYSEKYSMKKIREQTTGQENIFAENKSDIGLLFKIYEKLLKLNFKETNNPIKI